MIAGIGIDLVDLERLRRALAVASVGQAEPIVDPVQHPFAIILTRDCDLDWDYRARDGLAAPDKLIPSVLLCEMTTAQNLRGRTDINADMWKRIKKNKDERYQFLQKIEPVEDELGQGLPELGIDFKRYFTVPADELYRRLSLGEIRRRCRLVSPYLEHLSTRFCYFQFRVTLPAEHSSEPV